MTQVNGHHEEIVVSRETNGENFNTHTEAGAEEVHHYHYIDDEKTYDRLPLSKIDRAIWLMAIVLEIMIGFRVFLKLIAANPQSGFASFIYAMTAPFLVPFAGLTSTPSANGSVLEISSLIAVIVYALLFWLAIYMIHLVWDR
jgi:hypothetical protein